MHVCIHHSLPPDLATLRTYRCSPCCCPLEQVIRIFGFSTASADEVKCCAGRLPIQQAPFKYNEVALKHFDYFMDVCAKVQPLCINGDQMTTSTCSFDGWCHALLA
jgi:hypothetical protein